MVKFMSRPPMDKNKLARIRQGMLTHADPHALAAELGVCQETVYRQMRNIRKEWAADALDTAEVFAESYGRLCAYEQMALERGNIREARENRVAIVRLLGLSKGDRQYLAETVITGPVVSRTEIVVVEPGGAVVAAAGAAGSLPAGGEVAPPMAPPLAAGVVVVDEPQAD